MRTNFATALFAMLVLSSVSANSAPLNQSDKTFLRGLQIDSSVISIIDRDPKKSDRVHAIINDPKLSAAAKKKQAIELISDWVAADIAKMLDEISKDPKKHKRLLELGDQLGR
jgi:hypothetical protein